MHKNLWLTITFYNLVTVNLNIGNLYNFIMNLKSPDLVPKS